MRGELIEMPTGTHVVWFYLADERGEYMAFVRPYPDDGSLSERACACRSDDFKGRMTGRSVELRQRTKEENKFLARIIGSLVFAARMCGIELQMRAG